MVLNRRRPKDLSHGVVGLGKQSKGEHNARFGFVQVEDKATYRHGVPVLSQCNPLP